VINRLNGYLSFTSSSQCFLLGKVTLVFRQSGRWFFMFYTETQSTIRYMLLKSMTPVI
jgi:hypothetical protein